MEVVGPDSWITRPRTPPPVRSQSPVTMPTPRPSPSPPPFCLPAMPHLPNPVQRVLATSTLIINFYLRVDGEEPNCPPSGSWAHLSADHLAGLHAHRVNLYPMAQSHQPVTVDSHHSLVFLKAPFTLGGSADQGGYNRAMGFVVEFLSEQG